MRDLLFICSALVLAGACVFFSVTSLDVELRDWVVIACAVIAALYAAGLVIMGETIIEDVVKLVLFLVPAGIIVLVDARFLFVLIAVVIAGVVGVSLNQLNRRFVLARKASH